MRFVLVLTTTLCLGFLNILAITTNQDAKEKALKKLSSLHSKDFIQYQKPKFIADEKKPLYLDAYNKLVSEGKYQPKILSKLSESVDLPANFRTPGEFEESQAVLISWPSYAFDENGEYLEPFTPGIGLRWFQNDKGEWEYKTVNIAGYILDLENESPYATLWAQFADAIQKEATVWIRVAAPEDTTDLKNFINSRGYTLTNYEFKFDEDGENAFWMRDFGPFGAYYGDQDSLMFVIAEYYPGRPIDDNYPVKLAEELGYKYHKSPVELEGGNFMTDGHGLGFYSNVVYSNNSDDMGPAYTQKAPMGATEVNNLMSKIFDLKQSMILPMLRCDGGTGHIDLYSKMANDEEILYTKFPEDFNKFSFPDYAIVKNNRDLILAKNNQYSRQFRFLEVPLPTDDDGKYNRTSCNTFTQDARTYINGLTINKTFIVPIYSNSETGNKQGDEDALNEIRKLMPGYNVVGIDCRVLTVGGGAIHCISMQIPAENPVYIQHAQLKGIQKKSEIVDDNMKIHLSGKIRNHSGFKSGNLYYRCTANSSNSWNKSSVNFTPDSEGSISDFLFTAEIDYSTLGCDYGVDIEYYFDFETNNGKKASRPITAPAGFYKFTIGDPTSVDDLAVNGVSLYPNPTSEILYIKLPDISGIIDLQISDILGNKIDKLSINLEQGLVALDVSKYSTGIYFAKVISGNKINHIRFVISK